MGRAVLVAISIPIFNSQLEKSREAVDLSNMRAAYAVVQTDILTEDFDNYDGTLTGGAGTLTTYYDLSGKTVKTKPTTAYGKSTVTDVQSSSVDLPGNATFTFDGKTTGKVIKVTVVYTAGSTEPTVTVAWDAVTA